MGIIIKNCALYLVGLLLSYIATLIFISFGWADVGPWGIQRFIIALLMAIIIWTIVFISHEIMWRLMDIFGGSIFVVLVFGGIAVAAYGAFLMCTILFPPQWLTIKENYDPYITGGVYTIISFAFHPRQFHLTTYTGIKE